MADEIGIGMLGYAFMGKAHSRAFREIARLDTPLQPRLVAVAGRNEEAVADMAARYGYERWTTDWHDLVSDPGITLFDNGGPNSLHAEPTIAAAQAGKHVVCEKPLGRDADESYEIWSAVAATGVRHMCAFNYRFVPAVRLAREMVEAGELGEVRHFRGRYLQDWGDDPSLDTWRFDAGAAGSGALGDLMTHVVDLARFLNGEIETVSGFAHTFVPGRAVDDAVEAAVGFANGSVGTLEATRFAHGRRNAFQWEINGTKGSLAFDMERLNELQVFRDDGDRARGFKTVLVSEADHPFWGHWCPRAAPLPSGGRRRARRSALRRRLRGRLPRFRGLRRDNPLRRDRAARDGLVPLALGRRRTRLDRGSRRRSSAGRAHRGVSGSGVRVPIRGAEGPCFRRA
jgi:predicted dehydrogenase